MNSSVITVFIFGVQPGVPLIEAGVPLVQAVQQYSLRIRCNPGIYHALWVFPFKQSKVIDWGGDCEVLQDEK